MKLLRKILTLATVALALSFELHGAGAQVNRVTSLPIIDSAGAGYANGEGQKASYYASLGNNTPAATPTDVAILTGSSTKTITVTHVIVTVQATAAGVMEWRLVTRSGGTQSAVNTAFANGTHSGPFDSTDAASSVITAGLAGVYTSNPASTGTVVGVPMNWTITQLANGTVILEYLCDRPAKCIKLRGTTQVLAVNGNGHTLLTGEKFGVSFEWTEE
jgi:hypothetical protein